MVFWTFSFFFALSFIHLTVVVGFVGRRSLVIVQRQGFFPYRVNGPIVKVATGNMCAVNLGRFSTHAHTLMHQQPERPLTPFDVQPVAIGQNVVTRLQKIAFSFFFVF